MSKQGTKVSKKKGPKEMILPIKWHTPDTIITRFATNITVQKIDNEFKVSFFELKPKIYIEFPKTPPSEVRADCVASVIVTVDRMQGFIDALQQQINLLSTTK